MTHLEMAVKEIPLSHLKTSQLLVNCLLLRYTPEINVYETA